jgi:hypothetical protein
MSIIHRMHLFGAVLTISLSCTIFCIPSAKALATQNALWVAESEGVLKIGTADGTSLFELPVQGGARLVTVDPENGDIWTYANQQIRAFHANGTLFLESKAPSVKRCNKWNRRNRWNRWNKRDIAIDNAAGDIAIDSAAGNLWLVVRNRLYRFDLHGQVQQVIKFSKMVSTISLDRSRSRLWVATKHRVSAFDEAGIKILVLKQFRRYGPIRQIEFDTTLDQLWVSVRKRLLRYDSNGQLVARKRMRFSKFLAGDGLGGIWGANRHKLVHVDKDGLMNVTIRPFEGYEDDRITDLRTDPNDHSVWVANKTVLKHYAVNDALLHEFVLDVGDGITRRISRLALHDVEEVQAPVIETTPPADDVEEVQAPVIEITSPADNEFLTTNTPTIELHISGGETGYRSDNIELTANGSPLAVNCQVSIDSAVCPMSIFTPLSAGDIELTATLLDNYGHPLGSDQISFTVP